MSADASLDQDLLTQIERDSWKTSLLEKTREECPGMTDVEILAFLKNDLGINPDVMVSYCMNHGDACFGMTYTQVARVSGLHASPLLACAPARPEIEHTVVAPETEDLRMEDFAEENTIQAVTNDRNFMPYCFKVNADPDDKQTVRGYLLMHALASKTFFLFIGGSVIFPLLYLYFHTITALSQVPSGLPFGAQLLYLHETMNFHGSAPRDLLVVLFLVCGAQFWMVVTKIVLRILGQVTSNVMDSGLKLLSILRKG